MDVTDDRNEELKSDLHENSKVKVPVVVKPDDNAPAGEAVKEVIGVDSDLNRRGADKTCESAGRDSQGLNSVLEYASKIRAFIGLDDDSALSPVVSPGYVNTAEYLDPPVVSPEFLNTIQSLDPPVASPVFLNTIQSLDPPVASPVFLNTAEYLDPPVVSPGFLNTIQSLDPPVASPVFLNTAEYLDPPAASPVFLNTIQSLDPPVASPVFLNTAEYLDPPAASPVFLNTIQSLDPPVASPVFLNTAEYLDPPVVSPGFLNTIQSLDPPVASPVFLNTAEYLDPPAASPVFLNTAEYLDPPVVSPGFVNTIESLDPSVASPVFLKTVECLDPPVVSPGSVYNIESLDPPRIFTELDKNETDFIKGENKHVSIGDRLDDQPGTISKTNTNECNLATEDNGNVSLDTEFDHPTGIYSDNDKNESDLTTDDTSVSNELDDQPGTCSVVDKNLSDLTFNDNLRSIDKELDDLEGNFFKVDENHSTLEDNDVKEYQINNNEHIITCDISIINNDSQKLDNNTKHILSEINENINESDFGETKDVCEIVDNASNSSENSDDIVVDQPPLNGENKSLVLKSSLKMSDDAGNLIKTDNSYSDGIDLNDSQTILRDELADNGNFENGLGVSPEAVEKEIYSSDLKEDTRGEFSHTNEENNFAIVYKEDSDSYLNEGSQFGGENIVEWDQGGICLTEKGGEEAPSIEHLRRLSSEIVSRVLDSAENQLKNILEESQSENNTITSQFNNNPQNDERKSSKMSRNNSPKEFNNTKETITNNKPVKEINLKDVLSKTYDSKDFMKKIEIEMNKVHPEHDVDPDTVCGIGSFKPQWLQRWATAKTYLVLYSIIGILSGSYYSYLISSISTLEKRFAFKSKVSGSIMMVDEITPLFLGVLVGYFGGRTHRPRMVAFGMLLSSLCCFVSALPYFIYGAATHLTSVTMRNTTEFERCESIVRAEDCDSDDRPPTMATILFLMLGSFLKGFGNLAYYAVGLAYMDDNAKKKNTPMYFAVAFSLRLLGPLVGFLMSSGFLKFYENPFVDPGFGPEDSRWIGGWWMGFVLQGILLTIFTMPIALFPRRLPGHKVTGSSSKQEGDTGLISNVAGLFAALKRLAKNPLFIFIILNTIMSIYGSFGHYIMLPKYMENQFRLSASQASLLSGPPGIAALIVSTLIGGYLIYRFKPSAKILTGGMVVLEIIGAVGFLLLMIPQCERIQIFNYGWDEEGLILEGQCNSNCSCSTKAFTPVCAPDGKTHYFSPCFAACQEKTNETFTSCSCAGDSYGPETDYVTEGFCLTDGCWSQALAYIITLPIISFIVSVLRVSHTMVLLRSIKTEDKSVALGTFETFLSAFGFIPYPVVFGALIDSACLVFEKSCGKTGNCWFYDVDKFNYLLHGASALFSALSAICLFVVFCLSGRVNDLYEEDEDDVTDEEQKETAKEAMEETESTTTKL